MFTKKQIAALKYLIFNARNVVDLSKQVLAFLIEQSENLTKEVCLTLVDGREGFSAAEITAAGRGMSVMQSCNSTTHLHQILHAMGSELRFSFHYGDFDPSRKDDPFNAHGQFAGFKEEQVAYPGLVRDGMPIRYTFWFSKQDYSRQAKLVVATRNDLEQIDPAKPGLYPELEPA